MLTPEALASLLLNRVCDLNERKRVCFEMAHVCLKHRDAHGMHDMGVEIAALDRAIAELNHFLEKMADDVSP